MTHANHRQHILESLERGRLVLFIGADLPRETTGLPSRADLARELAQLKGLDTTLSLSGLAQRISRAGNRWEFTDYIRNGLDTAGKAPQSFHRRVVELANTHGIETLITTAYDNLMELAFQAAGFGLNRVVRGSDVGFIRTGRPTLIKLYGDAAQVDTLIVTEDDHYGLWRNRDKEDLLDEVRAALRKNTVLFLGYNLSDPDFNLLWREVLDRARRFAMGAYAVWPNLPDAVQQVWQDRGIRILETDPWGILGESDIPAPPPRRAAAELAVPECAARQVWDTEAIRQLLTAALSDEKLTTLCFDHFPSVYDDFGGGMSKGDKIQRLLDHCVRRGRVEALLEFVQERNPAQYARFGPRLRRM